MTGGTHIPIKRERTIDHLNPKSATHAADRVAAKTAREKAATANAERFDLRPLVALKFPTLGGVLVNGKGKELSGVEHKKLLMGVAKARSWYWSAGEREGGAKRRRKRKTNALHSLAILMRPDHAMALAALDKNPKFRHLVRPFIFGLLRELGVEFEAATGLEIVAFQVHPEEGVFHLHITYASVSAENELLWGKNKKGRHGLRLLGPSHGGTLRLIEAGFWPESEGGLARKDFADRVRALGGELPIDWRLAQVVAGMVERFVEKQNLRFVFNEAAKTYRADLLARRADHPASLKAAKTKAEGERDVLAKKVVELEAKLAAGSALSAPSSPSAPIVQTPVLPALPTIFLQRAVRDVRPGR